jgi:hypothetical protein
LRIAAGAAGSRTWLTDVGNARSFLVAVLEHEAAAVLSKLMNSFHIFGSSDDFLIAFHFGVLINQFREFPFVLNIPHLGFNVLVHLYLPAFHHLFQPFHLNFVRFHSLFHLLELPFHQSWFFTESLPLLNYRFHFLPTLHFRLASIGF